jgi:hypothetical protein
MKRRDSKQKSRALAIHIHATPKDQRCVILTLVIVPLLNLKISQSENIEIEP